MKKKIIALISAVIMLSMLLSSCELLNSFMGAPCEEHIDKNNDSYCDVCKEYIKDEEPDEPEAPGSEDKPGSEEGKGDEEEPDNPEESGGSSSSFPSADLDSIPEFDGSTCFVIINNDVPFFETSEITTVSFERFSELDNLGRCGVAMACIGLDLMPTEDREEIGHVLPSGWHSVQYDVVPGKNLYNRCHLIGFQLTGENDNEKNLITGTRDMNNEAMLPFENAIAAYVKSTGHHVMYRVTPIYNGNELVARGVLMEAMSVEDDTIRFCIYAYNAQPGVVIDYRTGESRLADHPHADVLGEGHDDLDVIPAAADDTVTHIYLEFGEGDEFLGAVVITSVTIDSQKVVIATDIDENGDVDFVRILSGASGYDDFLDDFYDTDIESADDVLLEIGSEEATAVIRDAVMDSLEALAAYIDATENGTVYIVNTESKKFHFETCRYAESLSESKKMVYIGYAIDLTEAGYSACGVCKAK